LALKYVKSIQQTQLYSPLMRMLSYFNNWGIQTTTSIIEATSTNNNLSFIASGGIQTALDVAKAIALRAKRTIGKRSSIRP
ncbi:hypothetical protein ACT453_56900, partial [Bacillus sp. D-CC]